jgi:hypothetical protein
LSSVGYFFSEIISFVEFLSHDPDDILGMRIVLGKDERLGNNGSFRKDLRQLLFEGPDDRSDLVGGHHIPVKLPGSVIDGLE